MTNSNEIIPDKIICPKCGSEQDDWDGFGFIYCHSCGYCIHPNYFVESGKRICGICGKEVTNTEE